MAKLSLNVRNTGAGVLVYVKGVGTFANKRVHDVDKLEEDLVIGEPLEEVSYTDAFNAYEPIDTSEGDEVE